MRGVAHRGAPADHAGLSPAPAMIDRPARPASQSAARSASEVTGDSAAGSQRAGVWLVFAAAFAASLGGVFARYLDIEDNWTVVFWRSFWACAFLFAFMVWRDGFRGAIALLLAMRLPSIVVALCFTIASTAFVVAIAHTTIANVVLMLATVPLIAAGLAWAAFGERITLQTGLAIALVIGGVAVMVSDSFSGRISPVGDLLSLAICVSYAIATVTTRRFAHVRMVPAVFAGVFLAGLLAAFNASSLAVTGAEMGVLFAFGALNLGLGLALFVTGARLIPAALAALISTGEPVMGPIWVWLVHGEEPSPRTLIGGAIVIAALLWYVLRQMGGARRSGGRGPSAA